MRKLAFLFSLITLVSCFGGFAQEKDNTNLHVEVKDGKKPLIIVDGKEFNFSMDLIDQTKIKSISVLKNKEAKTRYNTSDGVIIITTKVSEDKALYSKNGKSNSLNEPLIIIDGKKSNQSLLKILESDQIKEMDILKGKEAIKKYNSPGGVIIITTKKK